MLQDERESVIRENARQARKRLVVHELNAVKEDDVSVEGEQHVFFHVAGNDADVFLELANGLHDEVWKMTGIFVSSWQSRLQSEWAAPMNLSNHMTIVSRFLVSLPMAFVTFFGLVAAEGAITDVAPCCVVEVLLLFGCERDHLLLKVFFKSLMTSLFLFEHLFKKSLGPAWAAKRLDSL